MALLTLNKNSPITSNQIKAHNEMPKQHSKLKTTQKIRAES